MISEFLNNEGSVIYHFDELRRVQEVEKVILNYRTIKKINRLDEKFARITELYLNHNFIETLDGIDQFRCLRVLEIKFNLIKNFSELSKISNPAVIVSLNMMGNPIEQDHRFTFEFLKKMFSNLSELNGNVAGRILSTRLNLNNSFRGAQQNHTPTRPSLGKSAYSSRGYSGTEKIETIAESKAYIGGGPASFIVNYKDPNLSSFSKRHSDESSKNDSMKVSRCVADIDVEGMFDKSPPKHSQTTATFAEQNKRVKEANSNTDIASFPFKKLEGMDKKQRNKSKDETMNRSVHNNKMLNLSEISFDNSVNNCKASNLKAEITLQSFEEDEDIAEKYLKKCRVSMVGSNKKETSRKKSRISESTFVSELPLGDSRISIDSSPKQASPELELSYSARSHLSKHIQNIDSDIHKLARVFREKHLKERVFKGFLLRIRTCSWKKCEIAMKYSEEQAITKAWEGLKMIVYMARASKYIAGRMKRVHVVLKEELSSQAQKGRAKKFAQKYKDKQQSPQTVMKVSERRGEIVWSHEDSPLFIDKLDTERGERGVTNASSKSNKENDKPTRNTKALNVLLKENSQRYSKPPKKERYEELLQKTMHESMVSREKESKLGEIKGMSFCGPVSLASREKRDILTVSDLNVPKQNRR